MCICALHSTRHVPIRQDHSEGYQASTAWVLPRDWKTQLSKKQRTGFLSYRCDHGYNRRHRLCSLCGAGQRWHQAALKGIERLVLKSQRLGAKPSDFLRLRDVRENRFDKGNDSLWTSALVAAISIMGLHGLRFHTVIGICITKHSASYTPTSNSAPY